MPPMLADPLGAEWESPPSQGCGTAVTRAVTSCGSAWVFSPSPLASHRLLSVGWPLNHPHFNIFHWISWLSQFFLEFINSIIFLFCNHIFSDLRPLLSAHTYFSFLPGMCVSSVDLNLKMSEYPNGSDTCDFFPFVCVFINMSNLHFSATALCKLQRCIFKEGTIYVTLTLNYYCT